MSGAKIKTIKKIVRAKMDKWIESIENEEVRNACKRDAFVTGGSIASMMLGEPVKDYDIYFRTKETAIAVARYYVFKFKEANPDSIEPQVREETIVNLKGEEEDRVTIWIQSAGAASEDAKAGDYSYFEMTDNADGDLADEYVQNLTGMTEDKDVSKESKGKYRPVFLSQNAITLSDKIQLVTRFYGTPEDIYRNYDFIHVCQHYDYASNELVTNPKAMEALLSKTLIYSGSLYPVCSMFRLKKFIARGWKVSAGQMLKIAYQLRNVNWEDRKVMREQLTGVDAAYFHQLINLIEKELDSRNLEAELNGQQGCQELDDTYLAKLIDYIFEGESL